MDGKTKAIVAHITIIGWIIALVLNSQERDELTAYYIRQTLGIWVISFLTFIPGLGMIAGIVVFVLWLLSLISAATGEEKPVPVIGTYFQEWFKGL